MAAPLRTIGLFTWDFGVSISQVIEISIKTHIIIILLPIAFVMMNMNIKNNNLMFLF